jgi:hypothetical protein
MLCAALLAPAALTPVRTLMRTLRQPRQRRLHFKTESDPRRRTILAELVGCPARVRIYIGRGDETAVRAACLAQLIADILIDGAHRLVIESRDGRDEADRRVIYAALRNVIGPAELAYEHMRAHEEPLLWIADAAAWAYGAGGDWRRRVTPLVEKIVHINS